MKENGKDKGRIFNFFADRGEEILSFGEAFRQGVNALSTVLDKNFHQPTTAHTKEDVIKIRRPIRVFPPEESDPKKPQA